MMVVEFIGTPGAGKTMLLPIVREYFTRRGFNAFSVVEAARPFTQRTLSGKAVSLLAPPVLRGPLLWQLFYHLSALHRMKFSVEYRNLTQTVSRYQRLRPIGDSDRHHVLYWFYHLTGYYEFLKSHSRPEDVLILDEGFIHRVVQLFASESEEPDPGPIAEYIDLLPRPDLVIFPRASVETCERRVLCRGIWERFQHKSPAEFSRFIANSHAIVNFTVAYIRTLDWNVIAVDNDGNDPALPEAALQGRLMSLFDGPVGTTRVLQAA